MSQWRTRLKNASQASSGLGRVVLGSALLIAFYPGLQETQAADLRQRILAVADFGSYMGGYDSPDGVDDLLWLEFPSGRIYIQYMDTNGVTVRNKKSSIDRISVLRPGSGYFTDDVVDAEIPPSGGGQFQATMNVVGPVSEVKIIDPGRDYISSFLFDGNPVASAGSGFSAFTFVAGGGASSGEVAAIQVRSGGSGYPPGEPGVDLNGNGTFCDPPDPDDGFPGDTPMSPQPMVLIAWHPSGDMDKSALATVFVDDTGAIMTDSVASSCGIGEPFLIQNGSDFMETPTWEFFSDSGDGSGAEIQAILYGGITSVLLITEDGDPGNGEGYTSDPDIQFVDPGEGSGAKFDPVRGPGPAIGVDMLDPGQGFSVPPRLTIDGLGTGARLQAKLNKQGTIALRQIGKPGPVLMGWLNVEAYPGDFDGDGDMDIYFRHPKRNPSRIWFLEGGKVLERGALTPEMSSAWRVVGTGDFDEDGKDEIYWFNEYSRQTLIWDIEYVPGEPDSWISSKTRRSRLWNMGRSWQPMAILDDNESASPSIFWYAHEGKVGSIRRRNPNNLDQTTHVQPLFDVDGNGIVAGPGFWPRVSGDFDADGLRDDMLWQSVEDGRVAIWIMEGPLVLDVIIVTYQGGGEPVIAWKPVGVGNYTTDVGTEHTSVFWQCGGANISWIWSMGRGTTSSGSDIDSFINQLLGGGTSGGSTNEFTDVVDVYTISKQGTNSRLSSVSTYNDDDDDDSGSGSGGFDINQFDPNNPSTWPDGITNPIAMIGWLTVNVTADDPSSWPDSVNSDEELTVWLAQQVAALSGI